MSVNNLKFTVTRRPKGSLPGARVPSRGQPSAELKAVDTSADSAANTTPALVLLNGIVPGVGFSQRVGRAVRLTRLSGLFSNYVTDGTGVDQTHRVIVFVDHQPNASAPGVTDLLTAAAVNALPNLVNQARFRILHDVRIYLNASGEPGSRKVWNLNLPLRLTTHYNDGTAGTIADIATNSLYLLVIGDVVSGDTDGTCVSRLRLRYTDA